MANSYLYAVAFVLVELVPPGILTPVLATCAFSPLMLGRQAFLRPFRIGLCFVVADSNDRMIRLVPFGVIPILWNFYVVFGFLLPPFHTPVRLIPVATCRDERSILLVRDGILVDPLVVVDRLTDSALPVQEGPFRHHHHLDRGFA